MIYTSPYSSDVQKHRSTLLAGLAFVARESWWPEDGSMTDRVRDHVAKMRDATDALCALTLAPEIDTLRDTIEIEREGQRSMARALAEIHRLSQLDVAINLAPTPGAK